MLINVDMLPAMNLTKPYFQTITRGPRQPTGRRWNETAEGRQGAGSLYVPEKNNFLAKILPIYAPRGHRAGKTRDRCRPSGKTDRENRAARVVNDGGDRITGRKNRQGPIS